VPAPGVTRGCALVTACAHKARHRSHQQRQKRQRHRSIRSASATNGTTLHTAKHWRRGTRACGQQRRRVRVYLGRVAC
jgi:hypothetical protein